MRWLRELLLLLALLAGQLSPALARPDDDADLILARADADASGAWPVALLVLDGDQQTLTVRAPRTWLAELPQLVWTAVDAGPLLSLERHGAPRLRAWPEKDPCALPPRPQSVPEIWPPHGRTEVLSLRHPPCAAEPCDRKAWQTRLPGGPLALATLLPGLFSGGEAGWLALYIALPQGRLGIAGVKALRARPGSALAAAALVGRGQLPQEAALVFPALYMAIIEQELRDQGWAKASVLVRADQAGPVKPPGFVRGWRGSEQEHEALALSEHLRRGGFEIIRLLLRLHPADPLPALDFLSLHSQRLPPRADFDALIPAQGTVQACEAAQPQASCREACEHTKLDLRAAAQRKAWHYVEQLTGSGREHWLGQGTAGLSRSTWPGFSVSR